jgi:uncharacterized protein with HEPN domain
MKQPNDAVRLQHMLEAAQKAQKLTQGKSRAVLDQDDTLVLAITRLLEIIGEAANGVSESLRNTSPQIAWKQIIGARHHLIHGYFDVDLDIVWQIVTKDLPPLITEIDKILRQSKYNR